MLERRSALASALAGGGRGGALRIGEVTGFGLTQAAAFPGKWKSFAKAAALVLGASPPSRVGEAVGTDLLIMRVGPEQVWIVHPATDDLAAPLAAALAPKIGVVTSLSHARTRIFIEGPSAREILAKGVAVDFHSREFPVGRFVLTGLHHTPVLIHRVAEDRYEIYALRTFALTVWDWLTDAALPVR